MIKDFRIYKPNNRGNGAASKLELRTKKKEVLSREGKKIFVDKIMVFWQAALQTGQDANGNASFGWEDPSKTVTLKLSEVDLGEILAVLSGKKEYVGPPPRQAGSLPPGLFHKNPKGNSTLFIGKIENGYKVRVSSQKQTTREVIAVQHILTLGEAECLETLLRAAVVTQYGW